MKRYSLVLSANTPVPMALGGDLFLLDDAPNGGINVEFYGAGNVQRDEKIESGVSGTYATPENGFASIKIESTTAQTVVFYVARGRVGINRFSGLITDTVNPKGQAHTPAAKTAGAASAQMLAANANRKYLLVQNQDAAESAYLHTNGGAAAANNTCIKIGPGDVWEPTVPPTGAINMIRGGAADVALHVIEA